MSPVRSAAPMCVSIANGAPAQHAHVIAIQRRSLRVRPGRVQISANTWSMTTSAT
jgi:hypothetical protein